MKPILIDPGTFSPTGANVVLAQEIRFEGARFHKGQPVTTEMLERLRAYPEPLHGMRLEANDVHEDDAALAIAGAAAGPGVVLGKPVQSRVNLKAEHKGLLRIDRAAVDAINALPTLGLFTLLDRMAVLPGKIVAGAKITPVATRRSLIDEAVRIASQSKVVQVKPFRPLKIGVVTTEAMDEKTCSRFERAVKTKTGWYGGALLGYRAVANDPGAVAAALFGFLDEGADLLMTGGGNTMDPMDGALGAIPMVEGQVVRIGAPAHPGSMFWLAYTGDVPIFNLASCSMYSQSTVADLVLPWIMAGERVTSTDLAGIGYGGLLDRDMQFRFPPYDGE
ncbi:MAG: molybdopterin-binding protein [Thermomicrobiales bacterium]|nr:MAG: molybdopterin-binding protein [Thermomicrobiales bacterium]